MYTPTPATKTSTKNNQFSSVKGMSKTPLRGIAAPKSSRNVFLNRTANPNNKSMLLADVMKEDNVKSVLHMMNTAESHLDHSYRRSDFMQAKGRAEKEIHYKTAKWPYHDPPQKTEKIRLSEKISLVRRVDKLPLFNE